jgi:hypothetical protein
MINIKKYMHQPLKYKRKLKLSFSTFFNSLTSLKSSKWIQETENEKTNH